MAGAGLRGDGAMAILGGFRGGGEGGGGREGERREVVNLCWISKAVIDLKLNVLLGVPFVRMKTSHEMN